MTEIYSYISEDMHSNTYLIVDSESREAAIIDPSLLPSVFDVDFDDIKLKYVLMTHGHFDHMFKIDKYRRTYKAKVCIHEDDAGYLSDAQKNCSAQFMREPMETSEAEVILHDGDEIRLGKSTIYVMHTPGHTPGSVCYTVGDNMFSGDTIFYSSRGRTDFIGGSDFMMRSSLEKLKSLDTNYTIYSGHGQTTTLDREKKYNPHLIYMI